MSPRLCVTLGEPHPLCASLGVGAGWAVVGAVFRMRVTWTPKPMLPVAPQAPGRRQPEALRNCASPSFPQPGPGGPRERKLGEGAAGWTGSEKGWRPPSRAEAPRGGGGAGPALPFPSSPRVWSPSGSRLPAGQKAWGGGGRVLTYWGAGLYRGGIWGSAGSERRPHIHTQTHTRNVSAQPHTGPRELAAYPRAEAHTCTFGTHLCTQPHWAAWPDSDP